MATLVRGELHCYSCGQVAARIAYDPNEARPKVQVAPWPSGPGISPRSHGLPRCGRCTGQLYVDLLPETAPAAERAMLKPLPFHAATPKKGHAERSLAS